MWQRGQLGGCRLRSELGEKLWGWIVEKKPPKKVLGLAGEVGSVVLESLVLGPYSLVPLSCPALAWPMTCAGYSGQSKFAATLGMKPWRTVQVSWLDAGN